MRKRNYLLFTMVFLMFSVFVGCQKKEESLESTTKQVGAAIGTMQSDKGISNGINVGVEMPIPKEIKTSLIEEETTSSNLELETETTNNEVETKEETESKKGNTEKKETTTEVKQTETVLETTKEEKAFDKSENTETHTPAPIGYGQTTTDIPKKEVNLEEGGLLDFSEAQLSLLLNEIYPGDSIPVGWVETHPGETLYDYMWINYFQSKEGQMSDFYRIKDTVIDKATVECEINRILVDNTSVTHLIRLQIDKDGIWSVISDKLD